MKLKKQAVKCNLDDRLRDQIVIGVFDDITRKRLLSNSKLDLERAIEVLEIEEQVERR